MAPTEPTTRRIAIIGGGVTGLAAAYRLRELAAAHEFPLEVLLLEAGDRLGGALETIRHDECILECGADAMLSEKPAAIALAERIGLNDELVRTQEQFRQTLVVRGGRLTAIPEGFSLIAPSAFGPILRSPLFSLTGKLRMMAEPLIPRRRSVADESLAEFVTRRLGREVLERIAQPLAAGIYAADPDRLSAAATMPRFVEMERRYGSLIRGLRAAARTRGAEARGTSGARWSLFVSFRQGIGALIDALAGKLGNTVRYRAAAVAFERAETGWRVAIAGQEPIAAAGIICAAPAAAAARLIEPHDGVLSASLASIEYASAAVVNLIFRAADFPHAPASFGFVVPAAERRKIIAGSFWSVKFANRAPYGLMVVRAFIGGALQSAMLTLDDNALISAAREEFQALLGVRPEPQFAHVRRWPDSMPQYAVGHLDRVRKVRDLAAGLPGVFLAGNYLDGVGIPDCVRHGETAAEAAFALVRRSTA
jgi:oxygen-dependent protoporphyrinogen oxidase